MFVSQLSAGIESVLSDHTNFNIVVAGDFNTLCTEFLINNYGLWQLVNWPLSGNDSRDVRPRHKVRLRAHNIDHLRYALGTYNWSDITMMTNIDDNVVTTCHLQWNGSSLWQKRSGQVMQPSASMQSRHVFQLQFRASSIDISRKYGGLLLMPMHFSSGQVDILHTHYWHCLLRTCSQRQHRRPT